MTGYIDTPTAPGMLADHERRLRELERALRPKPTDRFSRSRDLTSAPTVATAWDVSVDCAEADPPIKATLANLVVTGEGVSVSGGAMILSRMGWWEIHAQADWSNVHVGGWRRTELRVFPVGGSYSLPPHYLAYGRYVANEGTYPPDGDSPPANSGPQAPPPAVVKITANHQVEVWVAAGETVDLLDFGDNCWVQAWAEWIGEAE